MKGWLKKLLCSSCHCMTEHERQADMSWKCKECGQVLGCPPLKEARCLS